MSLLVLFYLKSILRTPNISTNVQDLELPLHDCMSLNNALCVKKKEGTTKGREEADKFIIFWSRIFKQMFCSSHSRPGSSPCCCFTEAASLSIWLRGEALQQNLFQESWGLTEYLKDLSFQEGNTKKNETFHALENWLFCTPGDTWQCLLSVLVVTAGGWTLLASHREMPLSVLQGTGQPLRRRNSVAVMSIVPS